MQIGISSTSIDDINVEIILGKDKMDPNAELDRQKEQDWQEKVLKTLKSIDSKLAIIELMVLIYLMYLVISIIGAVMK